MTDKDVRRMLNRLANDRRAGKRKIKDKKISFVKKQRMTDEVGTPIGDFEYVPVIPNVWAYVRQTSAQEVYNSIAGVGYEVDILFSVNHREGLSNDLTIDYNGKYYEIKRIDYFEGYKEDILISATLYE